MGCLNAIFAPFIVIYLLMFFFFRYFEEFYKNPSSIGSRQYSQFARWKFREFNELPHYFQARLNHSYESAMKYISQFPRETTAIIARFVAFIAGSFAAVLVVLTLYDQELLLGFELSPDRTVFFYISIFGAVLAVARSQIPDENLVLDPARHLMAVVEDTHYLPDEWQGKLHTEDTRRGFAEFFDYKVVLFMQEIFSVVATPWILWFSLPPCSAKIVDFFREFTVHVDGLGYVCSFAVFDFRKHGNARYGAPTAADNERLLSKDGKMEKSFVNFKVNHPEWQPNDEVGSLYLSRLNDFSRQHRPRRSTVRPPRDTLRHVLPAASVVDLDTLHASLMVPAAGDVSPDGAYSPAGGQSSSQQNPYLHPHLHPSGHPSQSGFTQPKSATSPSTPVSNITPPSTATGTANVQSLRPTSGSAPASQHIGVPPSNLPLPEGQGMLSSQISETDGPYEEPIESLTDTAASTNLPARGNGAGLPGLYLSAAAADTARSRMMEDRTSSQASPTEPESETLGSASSLDVGRKTGMLALLNQVYEQNPS